MELNEQVKSRIIAKLISVDKKLDTNRLYVSDEKVIREANKEAVNCRISYKPAYPHTSNGDFVIYVTSNGRISIYGNISCIIPTIRRFDDICDFERNL